MLRQTLAVAVLALCTFAGELPPSGSVFGLDLGTAFLKIAGPKYNTTVDIVLNEQSRRKTPNVVGFRGAAMYVAEEANSFLPRFPTLFVSGVTDFLGRPMDTFRSAGGRTLWSAAEADPRRGSPAYITFRDRSKSTLSQSPIHSVEELTAMLLEYAGDVTTNDDGSGGIRAMCPVIAIPHVWSMEQREALAAAVQLAGLDSAGFVHSLTAAALQFGISIGNPAVAVEKARAAAEQAEEGSSDAVLSPADVNPNDGTTTSVSVDVILLDIGASGSQAGRFRFLPPNRSTKPPLVESLGTIETINVESGGEGSAALDRCIVDRILGGVGAKAADESLEQWAIRRVPFLRAARVAKEALSVSPSTHLVAEGVAADGGDLRVSITQAEFDELCATPFALTLAEGLVEPLLRSGAPPPASVELIGAGSRTAAVAEAVDALLQRAYDGTEPRPRVGRRLNTDEAVALGAAYTALARRQGTPMRVRSFEVRDQLPWMMIGQEGRPGALAVEVAPDSRVYRPAFENCAALPCTSSISVRLSEGAPLEGRSLSDEPVSVSLVELGGEHATTVVSRRSAKIQGLRTAVEDAMATENRPGAMLADANITLRVEVSLTRSGLLDVSPDATVRVSFPAPSRPRSDDGSSPKPEESSDSGEEEEDGAAAEESNSARTKKPKKPTGNTKKKKKKNKGKKQGAAGRHLFVPVKVAPPPASEAFLRPPPLDTSAVPVDAALRAPAASLWHIVEPTDPRPLPVDEAVAALASLKALRLAEAAARAAAAKKNELETLLLMERGEHASDTVAASALVAAQSWLEDGRGAEEAVSAEEIEAQLEELHIALQRTGAEGVPTDDATSPRGDEL